MIKMVQEQGYMNFLVENENKRTPLIFNDNQSALKVSESSLPTKKSKHFYLRMHAVREYFNDLCYISTDLNLADPLTKPVSFQKSISIFSSPDTDDLDSEICACYITL